MRWKWVLHEHFKHYWFIRSYFFQMLLLLKNLNGVHPRICSHFDMISQIQMRKKSKWNKTKFFHYFHCLHGFEYQSPEIVIAVNKSSDLNIRHATSSNLIEIIKYYDIFSRSLCFDDLCSELFQSTNSSFKKNVYTFVHEDQQYAINDFNF